METGTNTKAADFDIEAAPFTSSLWLRNPNFF
jgi:hypothetical protein